MASEEDVLKLGVLFVDDNQKILDLLKLDLRVVENEYNFHFELDPLHALERIKQGGIHIVFADFDMPEVNGLEWLKRVRQIDPMIVRLAITAFGDLSTTEKFVENAEVFGFIKKPWKREYLLGQLDQAKKFFYSTHPGYDGDPWSVVASTMSDDGEIEVLCKFPGIAPFDALSVSKKVFESFPGIFDDEFEPIGYTLPLAFEKVTVRCYFDRIDKVVRGIFFIKKSIENWEISVIDEVYADRSEEIQQSGSNFAFILHQTLDDLVERFSKGDIK